MQVSPRWRFPDFYYSFKQSFVDDSGATVQLQMVMIDTILLAGNNDDNEDRFQQPPGPHSVSAAESQWTVRLD